MYISQKNNGIISLIDWDWKEDPNWEHVLDAISKIQKTGNNPKIFQVETRSDENTIIVADDNVSQSEAQEIYNNRDDFFNWD